MTENQLVVPGTLSLLGLGSRMGRLVSQGKLLGFGNVPYLLLGGCFMSCVFVCMCECGMCGLSSSCTLSVQLYNVYIYFFFEEEEEED